MVATKKRIRRIDALFGPFFSKMRRAHFAQANAVGCCQTCAEKFFSRVRWGSLGGERMGDHEINTDGWKDVFSTVDNQQSSFRGGERSNLSATPRGTMKTMTSRTTRDDTTTRRTVERVESFEVLLLD